MIDAILVAGAWAWVALGLVLLMLEILLPGFFLLWLGMAAVVTGLMFVLVPGAWQLQVLVFAALSVVAFVLWRRGGLARTLSEQPLLNRPHDELVGREFVLDAPFSGGHGRLRIGDTTWTATGPDMPTGTRVKVVGVDGAVLSIAAA